MNEIWLAHHGIKGMKWGVRRFENPDGTLTEAGKKRYEKDEKDEKENRGISANIALDPVAFVYNICNKNKDKDLTRLPIVKGKLYVSSVLFMPFNAVARKNKNLAKGLGIGAVAAAATGIGLAYNKDRKSWQNRNS